MIFDYLVAGAIILYVLVVCALIIRFIWSKVRVAFLREERARNSVLTRSPANPLLTPTPHPFEAEATMNPAAIPDGDGAHLFYRAIGSDGVSRIGYAHSSDGTTIDDRLPYPVFTSHDPRTPERERYDPVLYPSGGSWGGCEDPRTVVLGDRAYLTFNVFDTWDNIRVAYTSLSLDNLKAKRFDWAPLRFLSPAGTRHKNWTLFPEKFGNKFAILHNLYSKNPNEVGVVMSDSLAAVPNLSFDSPDPHHVPHRKEAWHSRVRSAGPPPLKTPKGWLVFYHGHDSPDPVHNPGDYKLGAMLLDSHDPTKVLARAPAPILVPQAQYETTGAKPGIVYACGATAHKDKLTVYYGAADNFVCSASTGLTHFLDSLVHHEPVSFATT